MKLLPGSLVGRLVLLLGIALLLAQLANLALILNDRQKLSLAQDQGPAITRFAGAAADISEADPAFRHALIADLSHRGARFALRRDSGIAEGARDSQIEAKLGEGLRAAGLPAMATRASSPHAIGTGTTAAPARYGVSLATRLADGQWLAGTLSTPRPDSWLAMRLGAATLLLYLIVLGATVLLARRLARPLRDLTQAAERFRGRSEPVTVEARGPDDLRQAIEAFNAMNRRLLALLDEKDGMLGAIGHDLRTPLASLRIRIEAMEPLEEREAAIRKIEEMSATLEDMLVLARSGRQRETARATDVAALVETVVEEYQDLGAPVTWKPSRRVVLTVQPNLLKRALRNLVDNAVHYGGDATLALSHRPDALVITVADHGPGIPTDQLERITEPFYRLERSRSRDTGGTGLGLAIARAVAESHGGTLELASSPAGLTAGIRLPLARPEPGPNAESGFAATATRLSR